MAHTDPAEQKRREMETAKALAAGKAWSDRQLRETGSVSDNYGDPETFLNPAGLGDSNPGANNENPYKGSQ